VITPIPGWRAEIRQSGLILVPPEGDEVGAIRYVEQNRPLAKIGDIVASLPTPASYAIDDISAVDRFATVEGEHAAVVTASGTLAGHPVERTIGVVFADDFYSMTIGLARRPDEFARFRATIRELVENDTFMFGVRRRRFVHAPPSDWHGFFVGSMHTNWLPLDYPRNSATLTIYPALPVHEGESDHAAAFVRQQVQSIDDGDLAYCGVATAASGLSGVWYQVVVGDVVRDFVVLEDGRYIYPLALDTGPDQRADNLAVLWRVVDSIERVPGREGPTASSCADVIAHWID
jgi:hypothetical protein